MRNAVLLLCFCSLGAFAQVTVSSNQTRQVLSTATGNIGSPLLAYPSNGVEGWSIDSESNPGGYGSVSPTGIYFSINNSGQLSVAQSLRAFFPGPDGYAVVTLTVRAYDDAGNSDTDTVQVTIIEDRSYPLIAPGQVRQVMVTADIGSNVGATLAVLNSPSGWSITGEDNWIDGMIDGVDQNEVFFSINNSGQLQVLQRLDRFFASLAGREEQLTVRLTLSAFNTAGASSETVDVIVVEGTLPAVVGGQIVNINSTASPGSIGSPLAAIGNPTNWTILSGTALPDTTPATAAFAISPTGQLSLNHYIDQITYTSNPFDVTLQVRASSIYGQSSTTNVIVRIAVLDSTRCGAIPDTQTRYASSIGTVGDEIGDPIDFHGLDSLWIQAAWLDGSLPDPDLATYFTIDATSGQLEVARPFSNVFDPDLITRVFVHIRGHVSGDQCPDFADQIINVYVLPSDAGTGGGGGAVPDFSSYIDDAQLLSCIREHLGLVPGDAMTAGMVVGLDHLDCACRNGQVITDLDGLHLFTGLQVLNLSNNMITDIRPLASLNELTELRLAHNSITDITSSNQLATMVNLVYLDLSHNHIRNTNAFTTLTNLDFLSLASNDICDISSLVQLATINGLATGDVLILENDALPVASPVGFENHGNHLASAAGTAQIGQISSRGVVVFSGNNNGTCSTMHSNVNFPIWPGITIETLTEELNNNRANCGTP